MSHQLTLCVLLCDLPPNSGGVVSRGGAKVWQRSLPTAAVPRVGRVVPARLMSTSASSGVGSGASSLGGTSAIKILLGGGAAAGIIALSVYGASATNAYNAQLSDAVREQGEMMFYVRTAVSAHPPPALAAVLNSL